jgi:hypothetical protein
MTLGNGGFFTTAICHKSAFKKVLPVLIHYTSLTYSVTHDSRNIQAQQWNRFMLTAWSDLLTQDRQNLHITGTLKNKQNSTTKNTLYATMKQMHRNNDKVFRRTTELLSYGILLC